MYIKGVRKNDCHIILMVIMMMVFVSCNKVGRVTANAQKNDILSHGDKC